MSVAGLWTFISAGCETELDLLLTDRLIQFSKLLLVNEINYLSNHQDITVFKISIDTLKQAI